MQNLIAFVIFLAGEHFIDGGSGGRKDCEILDLDEFMGTRLGRGMR